MCIRDSNKTTRVVRLESSAGAAPAAIGGAYTDAGTFKHGDGNDDSLPGMQDVYKRQRVYCQGYHVSYMGNSWNKACIQFANKEIVD